MISAAPAPESSSRVHMANVEPDRGAEGAHGVRDAEGVEGLENGKGVFPSTADYGVWGAS